MVAIRRSPFSLRGLSRSACSRAFYTSTRRETEVTIGIRREDPGRIWERRCPLTPEAVNKLVSEHDVEVLIQDCERRVWRTSEYLKAGAKVHDTLEPAHIVLGIKETPLSELLTSSIPGPASHVGGPQQLPRMHVMFSHTIKGQLYNMELLSKFLAEYHAPGDSRPRGSLPWLIDYELLLNPDGKRSVSFGWYAGVAGVLEALNALAHTHLELGVASPLLYTPRPHTYPDLESIMTVMRDRVFGVIQSEGFPAGVGPLVIGITGKGRVTEGTRHVLDQLPNVEYVSVDRLQSLVYVVHALPEHYLQRRDGGRYSRDDYYVNPDAYEAHFHTKIAPYLSLLLNGVGWSPGFPRLMTNAQLRETLEVTLNMGARGKGRFACVGDISCDVQGGLEFLPSPSTLSEPFFRARPEGLPAHLPGVTMMAVDILPSALPREASQHFSSRLMPYLTALIESRRSRGQGVDNEKLGAVMKAVVARDGVLAEQHRWLQTPLGIWKASKEAGAANIGAGVVPKKKVLMLGSGMVAGPAVDEICKRSDVRLVIASNSLAEATRLATDRANAIPLLLDISNKDAVERLIEEADVIISLLPAPLHPPVADLCIQHKKHLVTASYISPAMRSLHERAIAADVLLLNEIGLDPGIDHCSALSLIDSLREQKKEIVSFTSFCGGLPAPEHAEGIPLGYKFSWSPKGVLTALSNDARFRLNDKKYHLEHDELLTHYFPDVPLSDVLKFEGVPNRDSLSYASVYGLHSLQQLRTLLRGTLRYPGFCRLMGMFKAIGLFESQVPIQLSDWSSLARQALEHRLGTLIMDDAASIRSAFADLIPDASDCETLLDALHWLSLIPSSVVGASSGTTQDSSGQLPLIPTHGTPPIDLFAALLAHKLRFQPAERDLVVLAHEIVARPASAATGADEEVHRSSLIAYGNESASAMAKCVGLPVAFAALQVLDGKVKGRGVQGPTEREVYTHILGRLEEAGLGMKESVHKQTGSSVEVTLAQHMEGGYRV
ncbi:hypothetical protein CERSUDRAFT_52831 [Gelatoporia subvermispora B]|uniref:Alanine dehydrogenase/pyridine nucleotide transhydrogenase N-terminal domain-containing protein n=1 Tax=Ceriporiopsis subvermispora (strain B) TaxID=914234 RepID=M2QFH8_CERS8|nr:hypothetical protein CERSUDRAFT_52831 [Gelatoporia subvermispora B]